MPHAAPSKFAQKSLLNQSLRNEKREHRRIPLDVKVCCEVEGAEGPVIGTGKDLSLGGMFIESANSPSFGTKMTVRVALPAQENELRLPAVVRWCNDGGFGVQFGLLGARETFAITRFARGQ